MERLSLVLIQQYSLALRIFRIRLVPFVRTPRELVFAENHLEESVRRRMRRLDNLQIVVVDDHKEVRSAMGGYLSGLGAIVHECSNADDALEVVVRLKPALVVSDIAMPGKDGFELLQEIRSLDLPGLGEIPVIAITGLSRPLDQMRGPAAGFDALLLKPFTPDALLRVISELLEV